MKYFNQDNTVIFEAHVIDAIKATVGSQKPETGGILGANLHQNALHISRFHFTQATKNCYGGINAGYCHYSPDHNEINRVVDDIWAKQGLWLAGIVHSHPGGMNQLSYGNGLNNDGDMTYFKNLLAHPESAAAGLNQFVAPIVNFNHRGDMEMTVWLVYADQSNPVEIRNPKVQLGTQQIPLATYLKAFAKPERSLNEPAASINVRL